MLCSFSVFLLEVLLASFQHVTNLNELSTLLIVLAHFNQKLVHKSTISEVVQNGTLCSYWEMGQWAAQTIST